MIVLAKTGDAFFGGCVGVFLSRVTWTSRDLHEGGARRGQHSAQLGDCSDVIGNVLEYVHADRYIDAAVGEREARDAADHVGADPCVEIETDVLSSTELAKGPARRAVRGDIEHRVRLGEDRCPRREDESEQSVTFERVAVWAFGPCPATQP